MKTIKIIGLITGIALMCFCSYAQDPIHYTVKDGLPSNHVYTATQDNEGFMWFGTNRGVAKFDGESFKVFTVQDGLPNNDIWFLHADETGKVWYGSKSMYQGYIHNDRVYKFITEDSTLISPSQITVLNDKVYYNWYLLKENKLVNTFGTKYHLFDFSWLTQQFKVFPNYIGADVIKNEFIVFNKKKVYVFNKKHEKIDSFKLDKEDVFKPNKILNCGLLHGRIFYFTFGNGILFIDRELRLTKSILLKGPTEKIIILPLGENICVTTSSSIKVFDINLDLVLAKKVVSSKFKNLNYLDTRHRVWSLSENGIQYFSNNRNVKSYFLGEKVQKVGKFNGSLSVGVKNTGVFSEDSLKNDFSLTYKEKNNCYFIEKDKIVLDNNIYVKSFNKVKLYNYDSKGESLFVNKPSFKDLIVSNDYELVLFSTNYLVINKSSYLKEKHHYNGIFCGELYNNSIFIGTGKGLMKFDNDSLITVSKWLSHSVLTLESFENLLYVGTDGHGLYVYDNEKLYHVQSTDGFIVQKVINKGGLLWLSTQKGVQCLLLNKDNISASKIVDSYYDSDGLSQNNTNDVFLEDSFLYVATDNGLNRLVLNNPNYKIKPILYFKNIADSMVYSAKEAESLVVNFGAIDFVNQKYLKYFYKIKPSESDWIEIKGKFLNFSHLEHGKYELIVRVVDQHNNENQKKAILVILPQWWETLIAKILIGIGLTFIAWAFFRYYANSNSEKIRLNLEMERKMGNLELLALRSQMNPHFVHNSLNSIQYFVQKKETSESEKYIASFSKLIRKIFELSRRQSLNLKEEVELITEYLEIESLRFEDKLTFAVNLDARINPIKTLIPSMILQPIIENAVNHGVFHKKEKGHISVSFNFVDALSYEVVIEDDGVGIHHTVKEKVITDLKGNRHSTSVLMERIELLKDNSEWDVSYSIIDLKKSTGNNGTRVTLIFNELDNEYI